MNYGYAGTRELNEALVSRFLVIDMPPLTESTLMRILRANFPDAKEAGLRAFAGRLSRPAGEPAEQCRDLRTKPLDLRGMIGAIKTVRAPVPTPRTAVTMGITNKQSFRYF